MVSCLQRAQHSRLWNWKELIFLNKMVPNSKKMPFCQLVESGSQLLKCDVMSGTGIQSSVYIGYTGSKSLFLFGVIFAVLFGQL